MSKFDDIVHVVKEFLAGLDIVEFEPEDIDKWARELANVIAVEVDLPSCDCPGSGHVYPCHDWSGAEG